MESTTWKGVSGDCEHLEGSRVSRQACPRPPSASVAAYATELIRTFVYTTVAKPAGAAARIARASKPLSQHPNGNNNLEGALWRVGTLHAGVRAPQRAQP